MFKNIRYFYEKTSPPVSRKSWVGIHPRTSMMFGFFLSEAYSTKKSIFRKGAKRPVAPLGDVCVALEEDHHLGLA